MFLFCAISSSVSGAGDSWAGLLGCAIGALSVLLDATGSGAAVNLRLRMTPEHNGRSLAPSIAKELVAVRIYHLGRVSAVDKKSIMLRGCRRDSCS